VGVFKVGLELFTACGPAIVAAIKKTAPKAAIFLDLKFHDIPATVACAVKSAESIGVDFLTLHCEEKGMLFRAAGARKKTRILAVTVLTSISREDLLDAGIGKKFRDPSLLALHRARMAKEAGLDGVISSGLEAKRIKKELGRKFLAVVPGIRLPEGAIRGDDQRRIVTPCEAIKNGADYIIVGRPIRDAKNPLETAAFIAHEIERALKSK
jgi:orotidine-5'-phosphate decarboxylase